MPLLLMAFLLLGGCAARTAPVQVDLRGWTNYLEYPVAISDAELDTGTDHSAHQLETILWRQERCRLRGLECWAYVRIFRNRHFGGGHLTKAEVERLLTSAGVKNISAVERLASGAAGGDTCYVVVQVLPSSE